MVVDEKKGEGRERGILAEDVCGGKTTVAASGLEGGNILSWEGATGTLALFPGS